MEAGAGMACFGEPFREPTGRDRSGSRRRRRGVPPALSRS